ncbi:MAG: hypothetical protein PUG48_10405 [Clostridia bacterium]|nr:hypothetical protein [Clostridia bacterium]
MTLLCAYMPFYDTSSVIRGYTPTISRKTAEKIKKRGEKKLKKLTPIKAIRAKCLDCCCWDRKEVKLCTATNCPLYAYREGHRPKEYNNTTEQTNPEKSL